MSAEKTPATAPVDAVVGRDVCIFDTDSDGNCWRCAKVEGGCRALGGPFRDERDAPSLLDLFRRSGPR